MSTLAQHATIANLRFLHDNLQRTILDIAIAIEAARHGQLMQVLGTISPMQESLDNARAIALATACMIKAAPTHDTTENQ
ncbi:MAG: hypothetical protein EBZ69_03390 [Alphaproteobacteria bacterium]|nr:hypothetical protein [Betaproteobacteria bacterium]NDC55845.1 hypothetical protein [Alphaproteobacteria bacterium]